MSRSDIGIMKRPTALIYSRSTAGHRQIYCHVLGRYLLARGFQVVVAVGRIRELPQEEMERVLPLIEFFRSDARTQIEYMLDTDISDSAKELTQIRNLNSKHDIDLNLFADGDALRPALSDTSRAKGKTTIEGRNFIIFIRLESLDPFLATSYKSRLVVPVIVKLKKCAGDYWFFRHVLPKCIPERQVFVIDPRFARHYCGPFKSHWMPDISAPFDFDPKSHLRQDVVFEKLQEFLLENKDMRTILFFGTNEPRKGYEWLLTLVHEHPDLVFLHCGRLAELKEMTEKALNVRNNLLKEGRIFETKEFVIDDRIIDSAFGACAYVLLPYSRHYGSSGIMIQAASYGKPVVVPRGGLMAYWVRKYGFGLTFRRESYEDFVCKFHLMDKQWPRYATLALDFSRLFSLENIYNVLDDVLTRAGYIEDECW